MKFLKHAEHEIFRLHLRLNPQFVFRTLFDCTVGIDGMCEIENVHTCTQMHARKCCMSWVHVHHDTTSIHNISWESHFREQECLVDTIVQMRKWSARGASDQRDWMRDRLVPVLVASLVFESIYKQKKKNPFKMLTSGSNYSEYSILRMLVLLCRPYSTQ